MLPSASPKLSHSQSPGLSLRHWPSEVMSGITFSELWFTLLSETGLTENWINPTFTP